MKVCLWGLAAVALGGAAFQPAPKKQTVVFVSGGLGGVLTPCGCTKPMSGGIRRRATAIRELGGVGAPVVLDLGEVVSGASRQDELKAETVAEAWKAMGVAAFNISYTEARLGTGVVGSIARLGGERAVCTSLPEGTLEGVARWRVAGPFLIGGVDPRSRALAESIEAKDVGVDRAIADLLNEAKRLKKQAVLLFSGDAQRAREVARKYPALTLMAHVSTARPESRVERVGNVSLVSPGEQGRFLIRLVWDGSRFVRVDAIDLAPSFGDDAKVAAIYRTYQDRVRSEGLLDRVDRGPSEAFAGTMACGACHSGALEAWRKSGHSHALATLEADRHDADPDCVGCHVVGLDKSGGFRSRLKSPDLANVGCESCHGAGARHAEKPTEVPMAKVGARSCAPCHTANTSPNFNFAKAWERIRH